jgi:predicted TIM-barrel enzyme
MHQHMTHAIERELEEAAKEISHRYGAPVVIVMGDTTESDVPRVMTAFADQADLRLRDVVGLLQTAIQYEGIRHFAL